MKVKPAVEISLAPIPDTDRVYLGHELVGEVVEAGTGVTRFAVGDRVAMEARPVGSPNCHTQEIESPCRQCASGQSRLCEYKGLGLGPDGIGGGWGDSFIAHESELWPVPDDLDDDQASLIEPAAVALHGVLRRPPQSGEKTLIIGAGIVGLLSIQAAKHLEQDAHVTVLARYEHQAEMARKLGADIVVMEGDTLFEYMAEISNAKHYKFFRNRGMLLGGFDVVYDCVGSAETVNSGLRWARAGGSFVLVGLTFESMRLDISPVWYQEVDLIGSHTFGTEEWKGKRVHTYDLIIEMMQKGALRHQGLITHRFPFEAYKEAIATAADKSSGAIKVTFEYGPS
jgi:threonine dehydrogenase-like Zn-dependent dehydrogenase